MYYYRSQLFGNMSLNNNTYFYDTSKGSELTSIQFLKKMLDSKKEYKNVDNKDDSKIILPNLFDLSEKILFDDLSFYRNKIFMNIPKNRILGNRSLLWQQINKNFNKNKSLSIMPMTYILPNEYELYKKNYNPKQKMVFKTLDHKQNGIYITKLLITESMIKREKFIVVQQYLLNPFLYKNHKINMRIYLLVDIHNNNFIGYVNDDGIISYAKNNYKNGNIDSQVSSFYDSKNLYNNNYPITFKQLFNQEQRTKLLKEMNRKINNVLFATYEEIIKKVNLNDNRCVEVFGVDFFIDHNLNCKILEINTGPGMKPHNIYDKRMREGLMNNIILLLENKKHNLNKTFQKKY